VVQLSERAQLGAQALEALSNGQPVSDQLTVDIIAAAVRSFLVFIYLCISLYLFWLQQASCLSVGPRL